MQLTQDVWAKSHCPLCMIYYFVVLGLTTDMLVLLLFK